MTFYSGLVSATVGLMLMVVQPAAPVSARLLAILIVMGLLCTLGSLCVVIAVKHAPSAMVSHYHYTQLVSGAIIAYND